MDRPQETQLGQIMRPQKRVSLAALALLLAGIISSSFAHATFRSRGRVSGVSIGTNLVTNPSFETSLAGWSSYHGAVLERVIGGQDGSFAVRAVRPGTTVTFGINDSPNYVRATEAGGVTYQFGAWVRTPVGSVIARIRAREYANRTLLQMIEPGTVATSDWQRVEGQITTTQAGTSLDLQVYGEVGSANEVWVDGVTLEVISHGPVVLAPPAVDASAGTLVEIPVTASDADGDPLLTLHADLSELPTGDQATFDVSPDHTRGTLRWTPQFEDGGGTYAFRFIASNDREGEATTRVSVAPSGPSLVGNPSFENGLLGWNGSLGTTLGLSSIARSGSSALAVQGGADPHASFSVTDSPNWVAASTAGARYRFACWVRADAPVGKVRIVVREYLNRIRVAASYSDVVDLSTGWRKVVVDHVAVANGSSLDMSILFSPDVVANARFYVDDASIRVIDAP